MTAVTYQMFNRDRAAYDIVAQILVEHPTELVVRTLVTDYNMLTVCFECLQASPLCALSVLNQLVVLALRFRMNSVLQRAHEQQQALEPLLTHGNLSLIHI